MQVLTRSNQSEPVSFDKITERIKTLCLDLDKKYIDPAVIAKETIVNMYDNITTSELDNLSANICANKIYIHPDYNKLAARIAISNLQKNTENDLMLVTDCIRGMGILSDSYYEFVKDNISVINGFFDYSRDYLLDYFGIRTLERSYLIRNRTDNTILERPQYMWMRTSIQVNYLSDVDISVKLERIKQSYDLISELYMTHATPTLFNSGTRHPQLSSCFLLDCADSIEDIFKTITNTAQISKWSGGIGIHISDIRGKNSIIRSTNGKTEGIVPLCKTLESVARYINQGGKRNGSIAVYIEPWHIDISEFIQLRKNTGDENLRARDLFLALWIPDLFMKRVLEAGKWSLFCPDKCKGLTDTYGEEFERLYQEYEEQKMYSRQVDAVDLWREILESQIETGMPYMLYKDSINKKSNQKNVGVIKSSNLCLSGDTPILTTSGWIPIKLLEDKRMQVWNGVNWSVSLIRKTSDKAQLFRVELSDGTYIDCTSHHEFLLPGNTCKIKACELKQGQKLYRGYDLPVVYSSEFDFDNAYSRGWITSKGFQTRDEKMHVYISDKRILAKFKNCQVREMSENYWDIEFTSVTIKSLVPHRQNTQVKIDWLAGLFDSCSVTPGKISLLDKRVLYQTLLICQTLGTKPWIESNTLNFSRADFCKLCNLGLETQTYTYRDIDYTYPELEVVSVKPLSEEPTWCFGEPYLNQGLCNGMLVGNCAEILEVSTMDEIAVCNLASICLPKFVDKKTKTFDYAKLRSVVAVATRNLNNVIDCNYYPVPETRKSNLRHRPIGIGIQGLFDVYCILGLSFDSEGAREINRKIFQHIYYAALQQSCELAIQYGPYHTFEGSPFSYGVLQFDMWNLSEDSLDPDLDWVGLKQNIITHGTRNSLLTALMPTASTSQIMGNCESFEPYSSNIFVRKTLAGEYIVVNRHLVDELVSIDMWNTDMYNKILYYNGSIQNILEIPEYIRNIYKTAFEIKQVEILRQAIARAPFIDHTQSMNIFLDVPDYKKLSSSHFYGWKGGLKTGMYYLRTKPAVEAIKFGLDAEVIKRINTEQSSLPCKLGYDSEGCEVCSS